MPDDTEDRDRERALAELFERTAARPSREQRERLSALARSVTERSARRHLDRRLVWPVALAAAAAISYLVVAPPRGVRQSSSNETVPSAKTSVPALAAPVVRAPKAEPPQRNASAATDPDDFFAPTAADDLDELEPLELGPLFAPSEPTRSAELATAVERLGKDE